MAGDEEGFENLAFQQRLKAAVHYTVGQICDSCAAASDVEYSKQLVAVLAEATYRYTQTIATDLELFAKHAKRCVINVDDVKLLVRKSPQLYEHITELSNALSHENEQKKARTKKGQRKKTSAAAAAAGSSTSNVLEETDE